MIPFPHGSLKLTTVKPPHIIEFLEDLTKEWGWTAVFPKPVA
jgi:hypothetical protein